MVKLRIAAIVASIAAFASVAQAEPITYTFSGVASGTLGALGFLNSDFTVTLVGDTTNVTSSGGEHFNVASNAVFSLDGVFTGNLLGVSNEVVVNNDPASPIIIFGQAQSMSPFFVAKA
jgi:uncharacterized protein YaiE (UPF0345 family)